MTSEGARGAGWLIRGYFLPAWRSALVLLGVVLAVMGLELAMPLLAGRFIDRTLAAAPVDDLRRIAVWFVVLAVAFGMGRVLQFYLSEAIAQRATNHLRGDLTRHCLRLDAGFHQTHRPGELFERIEGDVAALGKVLSTLLVTLLGNALLLLGILVTLFFLDWRLGALLTAFVAVIVAVLNVLRGRASPMWAEAMQAQADQTGLVGEHLDATEDLRGNAAIPFSMRGFTDQSRGVLASTVVASRQTGALERVTELLFMLSLASSLGLGAWLVSTGEAPIATIYLIYRYATLLSAPIYRINHQVSDLQRAAAAVDRVRQLFDQRSAVRDGAGVLRQEGPAEVSFEDVTFGYEAVAPVLHRVSFTVPAGQRLGVVGRTGSGKSTVARLLLRLFDPQEGRVRLGGHDLRDHTTREVRDRVSLITQDVQLMHASLRDNLTLFDRSVSDALIHDVVEELGLGVVLDRLPHGLDTVLTGGDGGLSGGQAQLIALGRAFLRDPDVVVLDEATSRLDPATQSALEAATERLLRGRTALVIAHRLSTLDRMDQILVLDHGRVAEHGDRARLATDVESRFAGMLRLDDVGSLTP